MPTTIKFPLVLKKERDRRDKLKRQIRQKQKELINLKKALGAAQQHPPQRSSKINATGTTAAAAADRPVTLNLTRADFTDLLLPQLRAYTWVFYNRMRLLNEEQRKYLDVENLLVAIRDALRDQESDGGEERATATAPPLLRVEDFTDEELEALAVLKDRIRDDHEAMREVQRRGKGQDGVLDEVLRGLRALLRGVEGGYYDEGEEDEEEEGAEEYEDDADDEDGEDGGGGGGDDNLNRPSYPSSAARLTFVPVRRAQQLPSPELSSSPPRSPNTPRTPVNHLPVVVEDDSDDEDSDSDTDME